MPVTSSSEVTRGEVAEQHERLVERGVDVVGPAPAGVHGRVGADHVVVGQQVGEAELVDPLRRRPGPRPTSPPSSVWGKTTPMRISPVYPLPRTRCARSQILASGAPGSDGVLPTVRRPAPGGPRCYGPADGDETARRPRGLAGGDRDQQLRAGRPSGPEGQRRRDRPAPGHVAHPGRPRRRCHLHRHGRGVRLRPVRGADRDRSRLPSGRGRHRHQVQLGHLADAREAVPGSSASSARPRTACAASAPTASTCSSSTSPIPRRPSTRRFEAFSRLKDQGKVLEVGCCNFTGAQLDESFAAAERGGWAPFVAAQNGYSLLSRRIEDDLVPALRRHGVGLIPYWPLAGGLLTGKYRRGEEPAEGTRMSGQPEAQRRPPVERPQLRPRRAPGGAGRRAGPHPARAGHVVAGGTGHGVVDHRRAPPRPNRSRPTPAPPTGRSRRRSRRRRPGPRTPLTTPTPELGAGESR